MKYTDEKGSGVKEIKPNSKPGTKPELKLIPPTDPRVQSAIAPFDDVLLKEFGFKDRQDLVDDMFSCMRKYGGIGLTCNQVGLPFNMFVLGDNLQIENGLKMACFNPMIMSVSDETVMMKEGCLTFPWLFLSIVRPRKCVAKFTDEKGDLKEAHLDGIMSRIYQHEYDHTIGRNFTEKVSKMKLEMGRKRALKDINKARRNALRREKR